MAEETIGNISGLDDKELVDMLKGEVDKESNPKTTETPPKKTEGADKPKDGEGKPEDKDKKVEANDDPYKDLTPEQLKEKLKALENSDAVKDKRIKDKDEFIAKRNAEIARLRKEISDKKNILSEKKVSAEDFTDDPVNAARKVVQEENNQKEIVHLTMQEILLENEQRVRALAPDYEDYVNDIISIAKSKGIPQENLDRFAQNPFNGEPDALIGFYYEAKLKKEREVMAAQLKELENKPKNILDKIDAASRNKPLTSKTGASDIQTLGEYSEESIAELSSEDLSRLLKESAKSEK